MPDVAFPSVGPLGISSPPSQAAIPPYRCHRYYAPLRLPTAHFRSLRFSLAPQYPVIALCLASFSARSQLESSATNTRALDIPVPLFFRHSLAGRLWVLPGSLSYPFEYMPRSLTPVASPLHRLSASGTAAFRTIARRRLSLLTETYPHGPQHHSVSRLYHAACILATPGFMPPSRV